MSNRVSAVIIDGRVERLPANDDLLIDTGSSIIATDLTSTYMLYADASNKIASTDKLTFDGTNFTLASGSYLAAVDDLILVPGSAKSLRLRSDGDARGQYAVDLQMVANNDSEVASGCLSVALGSVNTVAATRGIAVGTYNTITAGNYSIAVGYNNTVNSGGYSIGLGSGNALTGLYSKTFGQASTASGTGSICIGRACTSSGSYSIAMGYNAEASENYTLSIGYNSVADLFAQFAYSGGSFAADGDCQFSMLIGRNSTTDATPTEIFLNGANKRITIDQATSHYFMTAIVARETNNDNSSNVYVYVGKVTRESGGNVTVTDATLIFGSIGDGAWACTVDADTTNQSLRINITGANSETIYWTAWCLLVTAAG